MDKKSRREHAKAHISPKLRRSLRMFFVIAAIMLIVVIFETISYHASIWQVVLGLIVGTLVGIVAARMYKLSWDKDAQHVTNNIDRYGIVILVAYVAFDLMRDPIIHMFTTSPSVPAISMALLAGSMYGRVVGSGHVIVKLLKEQEVFARTHKQ